jgi:preprotein translocase subunit YajC
MRFTELLSGSQQQNYEKSQIQLSSINHGTEKATQFGLHSNLVQIQAPTCYINMNKEK